MKRPSRTFRHAVVALGAVAAASLAASPVQAVQWGSVQGEQITLLYPGQSSWEWVLTPSDHDGAKKFRGGKDCKECHADEEAEMGELLVSGEKLEPDPIAGKPGSLPVTVQAAHDGSRLYVRLQWQDTGFAGAEKADEPRIKATVMLDDRSVPAFVRGGCWAACHDDVQDMPSDTADLDLTKYLARSRTQVTRSGGGTSFKSDGEIEDMLNNGTFLEYWQAQLDESGLQGAEHGYILAERHQSESSSVEASAELSGGTWTVVLSRALEAEGPGEKPLEPGSVLTVGFAVHDGYAEGRRHYVSFEHTLSVGAGEADLVAAEQ